MLRSATSVFSICATFCLAASAAAGTVSLAEFDTPGDAEGFTTNNCEDGSMEVQEGHLKAVSSTGKGSRSLDPQLHKTFVGTADGPISPEPGQTFLTLEFRVRETASDGGVVAEPSTEGMIAILNGKPVVNSNSTSNLPDFTFVESGDGFFTFTGDISTLGATPIRNLRLDPIGGPGSNGNTFEVDYVHVHTAAEPG